MELLMFEIPVHKSSSVGAIIKARRDELGLTQAQLADSLVFPRDYLVDLEAGKPNLYITRLFRVLNELGITVKVCYEPATKDTSDG